MSEKKTFFSRFFSKTRSNEDEEKKTLEKAKWLYFAKTHFSLSLRSEFFFLRKFFFEVDQSQLFLLSNTWQQGDKIWRIVSFGQLKKYNSTKPKFMGCFFPR
jgi:hypothetical protein